MKAFIIILSLTFFTFFAEASTGCAGALDPDASFSEESGDGVVTETRRVKSGSITTFEEVEVDSSAHFEETSDEDVDAHGEFSDGGDNIDSFGVF